MKQTRRLLFFGMILPLLFACGGEPSDSPNQESKTTDSVRTTSVEITTLSGQTAPIPFVLNSNLVHARFPMNENGIMGNEEEGFGMYWTEDNWSMQDSLNDPDTTFARMVVDAPFAGEYPLQLQAKAFNQNYPFRVYVNSLDKANARDLSVSDSSYSWGRDPRNSATFNVTLNKGRNVLLFQVIRWGAAMNLIAPIELVPVKAKGNGDGEYLPDDFIYQAAYLEDGIDLLNPEAAISYKALRYDPDYGFEGAAILHFTPKSTTRSLDVTYKITTKTENQAGLKIRLGNSSSNEYSVDLSSESLSTEKTCHIPSYALDELGFAAGVKQNIHFSSASGSLSILKVKESATEDRSTEKVLNASAIKANTLVRGRNIASSNTIGLDWTSAGIEFNIVGGGDITANMVEVADAFGQIGSAAGGTRFAVEIDHVFTKYITPSSTAVIASNLSSTSHHVAIYKTSEAAGGLVDLKSLKVNPGATLSKPAKDYKFEILGDSITCGNQISATEENGYLAYTTQLSKSYNANLNAVSVSGRGLKVGYNSEAGWAAQWDHQINSLWTQTSYFRDGGAALWNTSDYIPDVVICNLGNNDLGSWIMANAPMTIAQFTDEVKSFSRKLRAAYPNAKIIWTYGAFENRSYEPQYRSAVESLNDSNIQFVYLDQMPGGAQNHPNAEQHQTIANVLSAKIATMLGVANPRS